MVCRKTHLFIVYDKNPLKRQTKLLPDLVTNASTNERSQSDVGKDPPPVNSPPGQLPPFFAGVGKDPPLIIFQDW